MCFCISWLNRHVILSHCLVMRVLLCCSTDNVLENDAIITCKASLSHCYQKAHHYKSALKDSWFTTNGLHDRLPSSKDFHMSLSCCFSILRLLFSQLCSIYTNSVWDCTSCSMLMKYGIGYFGDTLILDEFFSPFILLNNCCYMSASGRQVDKLFKRLHENSNDLTQLKTAHYP